MYEMLKIEGRIQRLEIYDSLSAFGKSGDTQIAASAILSGVAKAFHCLHRRYFSLHIVVYMSNQLLWK